MLDLLPLIRQEGDHALPEAEHQPNQPTQPSQPSVYFEPNSVYIAAQQPAGPSRDTVWSPQKPRTSSKGSILLAKYKTLVKNGRRKSDSDADDSHQNGRRGSSGAEDLENFNPLASGENGAGSNPFTDDTAREQLSTSGRSMSPPREQPATFMEKVLAYKRKNRGEKGGSAEVLSAQGPLGFGLKPDPTTLATAQTPGAGQDAGLQTFFTGVLEAKALLQQVIERERVISKTREQSRTLVKPAEMQAVQEQIQDEIDEVTTICKRVKGKLDELDTINAQLLSDNQDDEEVLEHPTLQMRLSVMAGLNAKLAEVTKSWQEMRVRWQEEDREEVARKLHTVTGRNYEPEEVEQLIVNGGTETIYRQALTNISGASVQQLMSEVQQRHDQMRQLEMSMYELHQVFLDMSILVADQGDTINNIDNWVCSTRSTMQQSLRQLRQAKRDRRKAAQTKAITFVTGVGLVAGGAGLTATGVGAVAGVPMMIAGAAAVGGSAIGGFT